MPDTGRPLSPHLSVYRWPITMTLSILHRGSGVAWSGGLVVLVAWLAAAASSAVVYEEFAGFMLSLFGRILLAGWSFAFFFHLLNGIRHIVWDFGFGFEKSQANASAWLVVVLTIVLTLAYWLML